MKSLHKRKNSKSKLLKNTRKQHVGGINMGIFPGYVTLSSGFNPDELEAQLKKTSHEWHKIFKKVKPLLENKKVNNLAICHRVNNGQYYNFIYFKNSFGFSDNELCELAEKCLNICQKNLNQFLNRDVESEAEAYFHTHLMKQCLELLRK